MNDFDWDTEVKISVLELGQTLSLYLLKHPSPATELQSESNEVLGLAQSVVDC